MSRACDVGLAWLNILMLSRAMRIQNLFHSTSLCAITLEMQ